jgi:RNA polymerase sigma-70 factor (ECF subfamily)
MWRRARSASSDPGGFDLAAVIDDDVAFRAWYDASAPRVYAYLMSRTGNVALAEELTQETFIEVIRNPRTFDGRSDPIPWLIGVARHRLARAFQRHRLDAERTVQVVQELELFDRDSARGVDDRDDLGRAMAALPADQRSALMLRFVDDLPVRQVAAVLGRSEDATESLIRRARRAFEDAYRGVDRGS